MLGLCSATPYLGDARVQGEAAAMPRLALLSCSALLLCRPNAGRSHHLDKSGAVLGGPAALHAYARRRRSSSRSPPPAWLVCLGSLAAGLILGGNLALERVRM